MNPVLAANQAFFQAIIEKRVADICNSYVPSEHTYVILEGPRYTTLGYEQIAKGWADFCHSPLSLRAIEWIEGPFCETEGNMAWIGGIILLTVQVQERNFTVKFRATFVMRQNQQGQWQIKHEHVSAPMADPYGIGDWLKKQPSSAL
ncbi:MAG: nuclear transport factor 2 family protein [Cytophagales bacterium]|nr:nuclear transport factor 2 family protein [Bernardetiaceae bacterium]MDW8205901.1 nuclear transport factor 2 family protein [Cytophagales bacterium]